MRKRFIVLIVIGVLTTGYLYFQNLHPSKETDLVKDHELTLAAKQSFRIAQRKAEAAAKAKAADAQQTDASKNVVRAEEKIKSPDSEVSTGLPPKSNLSDADQVEAAKHSTPNVAIAKELTEEETEAAEEVNQARVLGPKVCLKDKPIEDVAWNSLFRATNLVDLHLVQPGETLSSISFDLFNTYDCWSKIWAANPEIKNPHDVPPGTVIHFMVKSE